MDSQSPPGSIDPAEFLSKYWQKQACFYRQFIPAFQNFVSKEQILSLSRLNTVESRLVLEEHGEYPWQVLNGPMTAEDLADLPASQWSILIQGLEMHLPAASHFLNLFNFIPNWRVDDLMVSYAVDQGGVGPHLDSYDVFLFQASGKRQWRISSRAYDEDDYIDGLDLRIIENFEADQEWILEPGDMLYLPPGVAHQGIALGECMTLSVGFRAPSSQELLAQYLDHASESLADSRYCDANRALQQNPGEIDENDILKLCEMLSQTLPGHEEFQSWFGKFNSRLPDYFVASAPENPLTPEAFYRAFLHREKFSKHAIRSVFIKTRKGLELFANGESVILAAELTAFVEEFTSKELVSNPFYNASTCPDSLVQFLCELYNEGHLLAEES